MRPYKYNGSTTTTWQDRLSFLSFYLFLDSYVGCVHIFNVVQDIGPLVLRFSYYFASWFGVWNINKKRDKYTYAHSVTKLHAKSF